MANILRAAIAVGCALAAAASAQAQQATQAEDGDIIVTAQFREQKLQDTPLSITAVDAALLEARGQSRINDPADQAPNVTLKQGNGTFGPSMAASIRGIGQYDFNPALEPGVGIYVDDIYLPTLTGAQLDLLDLERVELLRGPQGTLMGRNSIGGAIRLISQKPSNTLGGAIEASAGSADLLGVHGSLNLPLTENLFLRLSGVSKSQDGYVKRLDYGCAQPGNGIAPARSSGRCKIEDMGDYNYNAVRSALRFSPNGPLTIDLSADYTKDERTSAEALSYASNLAPNVSLKGIPYDSRFSCGRYCNYASFAQPAGTTWTDFTGLLSGTPGNVLPIPQIATSGPSKQTFKGYGGSLNVEYQFNDRLKLTSITGYRSYESKFNSDDDLSPLPVSLGQNSLKHHFFSEEVRLNASLAESLDATLGAYYSNQKTTYFTFQDLRYAPFPLQFIGNDPVNADTKAVFSTVIWKPLDALSVTGGLRYTEENKDYTFVRINPTDGSINGFVDPTGTLNGSTKSYSGSKTDYRLSVDYRWSPNVLTYATIATGFKGGGIGPRPFIASQAVPFGQEKLTSYEIGAKTDFLDSRLRVNASAFFNKYKDIQLTLLSCPQYGAGLPCALPANAGDADVKGVELELTAEPVDGLNIDASISTLDFEYTTLDPSTGLAKSDVAPFTPELKWSLGAQYEFNLGIYGSLTPRMDVTYQDSIFTNAVNGALNKIDAYTIANVRLVWRNAEKDVTLGLEGTNITDEHYLQNRFDLSGSAGAVKDLPGRPREWRVSVRKTF